jgi:hypothetical protein
MLALICRHNFLNKTRTFPQGTAGRKRVSRHWSADAGIASGIASLAQRYFGLRSDTLAQGVAVGRGA